MSSPKKKPNNWDRTLVGRYIRQIENPDSIGWNPNKKIWEAPSKPGYDKRNRGMGVDILNNAAAKALTEERPGRYLTEQEESDLRNQHIDYSLGVIGRQKGYIDGIDYMSPRKEAEAVGLIYRGDAGQLKNPNTALGKAYRSLNEEDFHKAVSDYYHSKGLHERAKQNDLFWQQQQPAVPVNAQQNTPPYFSELKKRANGAFQNGVRTGSKTGSWAYGGKIGNEFDNGGDKKRYIHDVLPELLRKAGLDIRVTSGYRPVGAVGTAGSKSWHPRHGAVDIVPQGSTTFEDIERVVTTNPEIIRYMTDNGFGFLDETNRTAAGRALMKKTGATGNHFHFGKDTSARNRYQNLLNGMGSNMPVYAQTTPQYAVGQVPAFMPRNPEAFFAPLSTYARPMEMREPEQPLVDMAALQAKAEREAQREQRQRGLELLMGLMGGGNSGLSSVLGLIGRQ